MTPEGKVKAKVRKVLNRLNIYYVMAVTGGFGNSGSPDFVCCFKGRFISIECKANGNRPTTLQESHLLLIRSCGGVSLVINEFNVDSLETTLLEVTS